MGARNATLAETSTRQAGLHTAVATAALVLAVASGAACAAGFELNGRALGDRIDEVLADERYDCGGVSACFLFTACSFKAANSEAAYGAPLTALTLYYMGERIAAIESRFQPGAFDAVLEAALREHGPAQTEAQPPGGADNAVYLWRKGARVLRLERFSAGAESSLIIAEQSVLGELLGQSE